MNMRTEWEAGEALAHSRLPALPQGEDDLAPARGAVLGVALGVVCWLVIGAAVWLWVR